MVNILDPIALHPGGIMMVLDFGGGIVAEWTTFTCEHCNRVITATPPDKPGRCSRCANAHDDYGRKRLGWICNSPGCLAECRNVNLDDSPLAGRDQDNQPWLMRDSQGFPVDRVWLPDGSCKLIRRKDNGLTQREMQRQGRPPLLLPSYMVTMQRLLDQQAATNSNREGTESV